MWQKCHVRKSHSNVWHVPRYKIKFCFKTNNMINKLIYCFYFLFYVFFKTSILEKNFITFPNVVCHATLVNANVARHATLAYGFE
jgi:hypothetical protein